MLCPAALFCGLGFVGSSHTLFFCIYRNFVLSVRGTRQIWESGEVITACHEPSILWWPISCFALASTASATSPLDNRGHVIDLYTERGGVKVWVGELLRGDRTVRMKSD